MDTSEQTKNEHIWTEEDQNKVPRIYEEMWNEPYQVERDLLYLPYLDPDTGWLRTSNGCIATDGPSDSADKTGDNERGDTER